MKIVPRLLSAALLAVHLAACSGDDSGDASSIPTSAVAAPSEWTPTPQRGSTLPLPAPSGTPEAPSPQPSGLIEGRCAEPGTDGLIDCADGVPVRVFRCEDEGSCLHDSAVLSLLASGAVESGAFRISVGTAPARSLRIVVAAEIADASGTTTFRAVVPAPLGSSARDSGGSASAGPILIDPSSEGAARAADLAGLPTLSGTDLLALVDGTRTDARADYSALSPAEVADKAEVIALDLLFVTEALHPVTAAVSADGSAVYLAGGRGVALFERDPERDDLALAQIAHQGVDGNDGLEVVTDVASSPDGSQVYVADFHGAVSVYARDSETGALRMEQIQRNGRDGVEGIGRAQSVVLSPDGAHAYVVGSRIAVFSRRPESGLLDFRRAYLAGYGLIPRTAISPDGAHVYVAGLLNLLSYARSGDGSLEPLVDDSCDFCLGLVVSPDGDHVYIASSPDGDTSVITTHLRDRESGRLEARGSVTVGSYASLVGSPDGENLYAMSSSSNLDAFARDPETGELSHLGATFDSSEIRVSSVPDLRNLAIAPDGRHLYAVSRRANGLSSFARRADGTTVFRDFVQASFRRRLTLSGAYDMAVSPDGANLYVSSTGEDRLMVFAWRSEDRDLRLVHTVGGGVGELQGLHHPWTVRASADGRNVYAVYGRNAGFHTPAALAVFDRDPSNGKLVFAQSFQNGEGGVGGLDVWGTLALSADGRRLYGGFLAGVLAEFSRDRDSGHLHFVRASQVADLRGAVRRSRGMALTSDGRFVYLNVAPNDIGAFRVDPGSGAVEPVGSVPSWGVRALSGDDRFLYSFHEVFALDAETGALRSVQKIPHPEVEPPTFRFVAISPDGAHAYIGYVGSLAIFERNAMSGELTLTSVLRDHETEANLRYPSELAFSPAGDFVFIVGGGSLLAFSRDAATGRLEYLAAWP